MAINPLMTEVNPFDVTFMSGGISVPNPGIKILTSAPGKFMINLETGICTFLDKVPEGRATNTLNVKFDPETEILRVFTQDGIEMQPAQTVTVSYETDFSIIKRKALKPDNPQQHYLNMRGRWAK